MKLFVNNLGGGAGLWVPGVEPVSWFVDAV